MSDTGSGDNSGGSQGGGQGGGRRRGNLFDDLAGMAGGAFSALAGVRNEAEAMMRSQLDQMVQRLDLVKREELDAAMEVARRAREQVAALEARLMEVESRLETRLTTLEARLAAQKAAPEAGSAAAPETLPSGEPPESFDSGG
jgi:BMFP domain-containing protein YqiC